MAAFDYGPDPSELAAWSAQRRQAGVTQGQRNSQLLFQRGATNANFGAQSSNLTRQYTQMRNKLPNAFIHRGLQNSGVYKNALQNYAQSRLRSMGDLQRTQQQQLGQYDLEQQNVGQDYTNSMLNVAEEEAARRASLAAALKGLAG